MTEFPKKKARSRFFSDEKDSGSKIADTQPSEASATEMSSSSNHLQRPRLCRSSFISHRSNTTINRKLQKFAYKAQIKEIIESIFKEEIHQNMLQQKMDYFYAPYHKNSSNIPFMKFETETKPKSSSRNPESLWKDVTDNIFSTKQEDFRNFLKSVNKSIYHDLVSIGKKYCNRILANNPAEPDLDPRESNPDIKTGVQLLKQIIYEKVLRKRKPHENCPVRIDRKELIAPLLYLSRGQTFKNSPPNLKISPPKVGRSGSMPRVQRSGLKTAPPLKFTNFRSLLPFKNIHPQVRRSVGTSGRSRRDVFKTLYSERLKKTPRKCSG